MLNVNNCKCVGMGNTNKTMIHIPWTQGWSIFVFNSYPLLFQNFTDLQILNQNEKFENSISTKRSQSKILDGQKHLYFVKDFFLPFYPKKKFFGKFFHLSWITSHNRIALIILSLITYIDLTKLLGWTILVETKSNTFLNYSH